MVATLRRRRSFRVQISARSVETKRSLNTVLFIDRADEIVSQTKIQGQFARDLPVILDIPRIGVLTELNWQNAFRRLRLRGIADA